MVCGIQLARYPLKVKGYIEPGSGLKYFPQNEVYALVSVAFSEQRVVQYFIVNQHVPSGIV